MCACVWVCAGLFWSSQGCVLYISCNKALQKTASYQITFNTCVEVQILYEQPLILRLTSCYLFIYFQNFVIASAGYFQETLSKIDF